MDIENRYLFFLKIPTKVYLENIGTIYNYYFAETHILPSLLKVLILIQTYWNIAQLNHCN